MNDKQLRGFVRIVESGSFTSAADELYITQSALSQQIKLLEKDLGVALFDHRTHKATLTVAGRAFVPRAQQLLALYGRAIDEGVFLQRSTQEQRRPLVVGCLDEQFLSIWMDLHSIMNAAHAEYESLSVRYDSRDELIRALLSGACQLSIQMESSEYERAGLLFVPFTTIHETVLFVGQPAVDGERTCTVEELSQYTVAFHNKRGHCLYEDALRPHLAAAYPMTRQLEPEDFDRAIGKGTVALLIPSLQLPERAAAYAVTLAWDAGIRLGMVMPPEPSEVARAYAADIQDYFAQHPSLWR